MTADRYVHPIAACSPVLRGTRATMAAPRRLLSMQPLAPSSKVLQETTMNVGHPNTVLPVTSSDRRPTCCRKSSGRPLSAVLSRIAASSSAPSFMLGTNDAKLHARCRHGRRPGTWHQEPYIRAVRPLSTGPYLQSRGQRTMSYGRARGQAPLWRHTNITRGSVSVRTSRHGTAAEPPL